LTLVIPLLGLIKICLNKRGDGMADFDPAHVDTYRKALETYLRLIKFVSHDGKHDKVLGACDANLALIADTSQQLDERDLERRIHGAADEISFAHGKVLLDVIFNTLGRLDNYETVTTLIPDLEKKHPQDRTEDESHALRESLDKYEVILRTPDQRDAVLGYFQDKMTKELIMAKTPGATTVRGAARKFGGLFGSKKVKGAAAGASASAAAAPEANADAVADEPYQARGRNLRQGRDKSPESSDSTSDTPRGPSGSGGGPGKG
jgi:hypothetical protein